VSCFELDGRPAIIYCTEAPYLNYNFAHATSSTPVSHDDWENSEISQESIIDGYGVNTVVLNDRVYYFACPSGKSKIVLMRSLVTEPRAPADWAVTDVTYLNAEDPQQVSSVHAAYVEDRLSFSCTMLDDILPIYGTCETLEPQGPQDWDISYVQTEQMAGGGSMIDGGGFPLVQLQMVDEDGGRSLVLGRGLKAYPGDPADWSTSLLRDGSSGLLGGWQTDFRGGRLAFSVERRSSEGRQALALYPHSPGLAGMSEPWVGQGVNPDAVLWSDLVQAVYSGDNLMCLWVDRSDVPGSPAQMCFATGKLPLKY
jgi:hypothetical protein